MYKMTSNLKQLVRELSAKKGKDYPLAQVAKMTGLSRFTINMVANNKHGRIDYSTVTKLAGFFDSEGMPVTLDQLFTLERVPDPSQ